MWNWSQIILAVGLAGLTLLGSILAFLFLKNQRQIYRYGFSGCLLLCAMVFSSAGIVGFFSNFEIIARPQPISNGETTVTRPALAVTLLPTNKATTQAEVVSTTVAPSENIRLPTLTPTQPQPLGEELLKLTGWWQVNNGVEVVKWKLGVIGNQLTIEECSSDCPGPELERLESSLGREVNLSTEILPEYQRRELIVDNLKFDERRLGFTIQNSDRGSNQTFDLMVMSDVRIEGNADSGKVSMDKLPE